MVALNSYPRALPNTNIEQPRGAPKKKNVRVRAVSSLGLCVREFPVHPIIPMMSNFFETGVRLGGTCLPQGNRGSTGNPENENGARTADGIGGTMRTWEESEMTVGCPKGSSRILTHSMVVTASARTGDLSNTLTK